MKGLNEGKVGKGGMDILLRGDWGWEKSGPLVLFI
jgi:hypothetical protein